jgi:signal peptidase I
MSSIDASALIADLLGNGHAVLFQARGQSMLPLIRSNDYLHVEPADAEGIVRGDVVLAAAERGLTAHRVVHITRAASGELVLTTRGDNVPQCDPLVPASRLLGRVKHAERDGRAIHVGGDGRLMLFVRRLTARAAISARRAVAFLEKES